MLTLIIGNKTYSSWSLRPWLTLRHFGIPFEEVRLPLDTPEFHARIGQYSPSGRVPVLQDGLLRIWDSLAIVEYVNERYLDARGWPTDISARARARAISAEMHSGFAALRKELPMNCNKQVSNHAVSADAARDIERIQQIWLETRGEFGSDGEFLFGAFSIADAMYAPVVSRFRSYGVALGPEQSRYSTAVLALPAMREWLAAANAETDRSDSHERMTP